MVHSTTDRNLNKCIHQRDSCPDTCEWELHWWFSLCTPAKKLMKSWKNEARHSRCSLTRDTWNIKSPNSGISMHKHTTPSNTENSTRTSFRASAPYSSTCSRRNITSGSYIALKKWIRLLICSLGLSFETLLRRGPKRQDRITQFWNLSTLAWKSFVNACFAILRTSKYIKAIQRPLAMDSCSETEARKRKK